MAEDAIDATVREVIRCTKDDIRINTFMLDATRALTAFVERLTELNRGRAFFTTPDKMPAGDTMSQFLVQAQGVGIAFVWAFGSAFVFFKLLNGPFGGIGVYSRSNSEHPHTSTAVSSGNLIDSNLVLDNNLPRSATVNDRTAL